MPEYETTNKSFYRGYPINTGRRSQFFCYTIILDSIIDRIEYMARHHAKVMCCRVDIHLPVDRRDDICKFTTRIMESLYRTLKAEADKKGDKNKFEMQYIWCSERNTSENEHVHCLIFLNGNANESGYHVWEETKRIVKRLFATDNDGLVQRDKFIWDYDGKRHESYGFFIDINSYYYEEQLDLAIYVSSYLAKTTYACNRIKGRRIVHSSRLPKE